MPDAWATFLETYPEYRLTERVDVIRSREYGYLDRERSVYLDYTGASLPAETQIQRHAARLRRRTFGNPHSANPTSRASTELVEQTRSEILDYFGADPDEYAVIFTANASAACRLVGESYPFDRGRRLVLTVDNHNSVHGLREFARRRHAPVAYVPMTTGDLRCTDELVERALSRRHRTARGGGLLAFPGQSNFTGVRHPLGWIPLAHENGFDVLLDAAALVPTARLDLGTHHPDFVPVSWYKLFGYPTGLGCLIARRDALARLRRPWFAGGTIQAVSVQGDWHRMARDETAFEDGTVNFLNIPDIRSGLQWITNIGLDTIGLRTRCLTGWLLDQLTGLTHTDGTPVVQVHGPADTTARGATVAFNVLDAHGTLVDERIVEHDASAWGLSLRTGCFCNPGVGEAAFHLDPRHLRGAARHQPSGIDGYLRTLGLPTGGAIRASFGIASNFTDAQTLVRFLEDTYRDRQPARTNLAPRSHC